MIYLQLIEPHWIRNKGDDPTDQCAHGYVDFSINGCSIVSKADGVWTVSATALFLLRSVDADHTEQKSITGGNYIFPCCGFSVYPIQDEGFSCVVLGCPNGIDLSIRHTGNMVTVGLGECKVTVTKKAWAEIVHGFASQVATFYTESKPKEQVEEEELQQGWTLFWAEWDQLMAVALLAIDAHS